MPTSTRLSRLGLAVLDETPLGFHPPDGTDGVYSFRDVREHVVEHRLDRVAPIRIRTPKATIYRQFQAPIVSLVITPPTAGIFAPGDILVAPSVGIVGVLEDSLLT